MSVSYSWGTPFGVHLYHIALPGVRQYILPYPRLLSWNTFGVFAMRNKKSTPRIAGSHKYNHADGKAPRIAGSTGIAMRTNILHVSRGAQVSAHCLSLWGANKERVNEGETSFDVNSFTFNVKNFSFEVIFTKTYAMKIYNLEISFS